MILKPSNCSLHCSPIKTSHEVLKVSRVNTHQFASISHQQKQAIEVSTLNTHQSPPWIGSNAFQHHIDSQKRVIIAFLIEPSKRAQNFLNGIVAFVEHKNILYCGEFACQLLLDKYIIEDDMMRKIHVIQEQVNSKQNNHISI
mgnify:CR=1 FL=1